MKKIGFCFLFILLLIGFKAFSQKTATIKGIVTDHTGNPLEAVNVAVLGKPGGSTTNKEGFYQILIEAEVNVQVAFSFIGYKTIIVPVILKSGEVFQYNAQLKQSAVDINEFVVTEEVNRSSPMMKLDPKLISEIPSASGNFEAILFSQPGVTSNNELSSQYSVRGGNFDENLIYVNGILIYRPFLVRSGQQEGLSFVNGDLVQSILFSSGGFESKYGDKMSSVLAITYKEPKKFAGSTNLSFLGGSIHLEDASKDYRFTQIHGLRYRSNQYILNGLDTKGDYKPSFFDYQTYLTYDINEKLQLDFLGNVTRNKYLFIPTDRQSDFGSINQALRLTVYFAGQEVDEYETYTGAFSLNYKPQKNTELKFITSAYRALETETFDIEGAYRLDELERDLGSDEFGDVAFNRGIGGFINHARNYLDALVTTAEHQGKNIKGSRILDWGLKYQFEDVIDVLNEWEYIDSTGYSSPQTPGLDWAYLNGDSTRPIPVFARDEFNLKQNIKAQNHISSSRVNGYVQWANEWLKDTASFTMNIGARFNYWSFNNQFLVSPRASFSWKPNWQNDFLFRFSWGYYHQPPFYREMRDLFGNVNRNIKAQTSIHYVLGSDYNFKAWNRPFKFTTELYYKQLNNLIPYEIDNVRLRYYATNNANGYATGIDLKVNGEFVKGVESWMSLSVMQTQEDLVDDFFTTYFNSDGDQIIKGFTLNNVPVDSIRTEPGFIPRPTDQRVNFAIFFQDYLPKNPNISMNLNILFGSGLPFGPPSYNRYQDTLRIPPYRRVDIGGNYHILKADRERKPGKLLNQLQTLRIGIEVFNLLQINNTISYLWVRDVTNRQYGIPNYLTNRQVNLRLICTF